MNPDGTLKADPTALMLQRELDRVNGLYHNLYLTHEDLTTEAEQLRRTNEKLQEDLEDISNTLRNLLERINA